MATGSNAIDPNAESSDLESNSEISESDALIKKIFNDITNNNIIEESVFSRPVDRINVPEPTNLKLNFVYNYYKRDEKVNENQDQINLTFSSDADNLYDATTEKIPRYVALEFNFPSELESNQTNSFVSSAISDEAILNNLVYEGTKINRYFTSTTLKDTGSEQRIYNLLKSTAFFNDITSPKDSQKSIAQKLHRTLSEKGGLFGEDKKLLMEYMSNIGLEGYSYGSEVSKDIAEFAKDPLSGQKFSVQFNKLLIEDLMKGSNNISDNVYNDELRYIESVSGEIKNSLLNSNYYFAGAYSETDYELNVSPTDDQISNLELTASEIYYPTITDVVGFLYEKYEISPKGVKTLKEQRILRGLTNKYAIDTKVKYGSVYQYSIRTIVRVKTIVRIEDDDGLNDQVSYATFFVASRPLTESITTIETVPPDPPGSFSVKFDYQSGIPLLRWQFPVNNQRDIKKFEIFKRFSINEPFTLIGYIDFDDSQIPTINMLLPAVSVYKKVEKPILYFYDRTHKEGEKPIYAVGCVDTHGLESNYSAQIQVEHDKRTNRVKRTIISRPDSPKPFPNFYLNRDGFSDAIKTSGYSRFKLFFNPEYYKVFRQEVLSDESTIDKDLNLLMTDNQNDKLRYNFHFINVDNQKDATLRVGIEDLSIEGNAGQNDYDTSTSQISFGR